MSVSNFVNNVEVVLTYTHLLYLLTGYPFPVFASSSYYKLNAILRNFEHIFQR